MKREKPWNRCDTCGRFIAYADFEDKAEYWLVTPDSDYTHETWAARCPKCAERSK